MGRSVEIERPEVPRGVSAWWVRRHIERRGCTQAEAIELELTRVDRQRARRDRLTEPGYRAGEIR